MGRTISFGDLERLSRAFGAWLQGKGLARGARVAVMMPNCLQYPVCVFGILRAGYVVVNVNPLYTARELEHQLKDSGSEAIVILENFAHVLQKVIARTPVKHVVIAALGDLLGAKGAIVNFVVRHVKKMVPRWKIPGTIRFNAMIREGERLDLRRVDVGHEDVAFLQYTGGTTGVSKGAVLLHRNILITNPRGIPGFVKELQKHKFTMFTGVNTLFIALMNHPDFAKIDFSGLKVALG